MPPPLSGYGESVLEVPFKDRANLPNRRDTDLSDAGGQHRLADWNRSRRSRLRTSSSPSPVFSAGRTSPRRQGSPSAASQDRAAAPEPPVHMRRPRRRSLSGS